MVAAERRGHSLEFFTDHSNKAALLWHPFCHLPLSVRAWYSWKEFPCCHDDVATTAARPCSLSPVCLAAYLWSGVDNEGMRTEARSLKNCVLSFPWDHVWVLKLFEMLKWWYQCSLRGHGFNVETNQLLKNPFLNIDYVFFFYCRLSLSLSVLTVSPQHLCIRLRFLLYMSLFPKNFLNHIIFSFFFLPAKYFTSRNGEHEPLYRCCRCRAHNGSKELTVHHHPRAGVLHQRRK